MKMQALTLAVALTAGLCFAGMASAQTMTPAQVSRLASSPECYTLGHDVVVRGAVFDDTTQSPVPDAVVTLAYAGRDHEAVTNEDGVYSASFPAAARAATVREVQTAVEQTGSHVPVDAQEGSGSCSVAGVRVGKLRTVKQ